MKHLSAFFRPVTNALSAWSVGLHSFFSHLLISAGSLPQRNVSVTSASAAIVGTPSRRRRGLMLKPLAFMLLFLLGSLNVWGTTATITFANQTSGTSDGSAAYTTSNFVSTGIASSDDAFGTITCSATDKCYSGKVNMGLKSGAKSSAGSFTISFSTPITNVSQITLNRAAYNTSKSATITVKNGSTTLADAVSTGTNASLNNMDITGLNIASLSGLTVETSKYCYIKSITITYTPSGSSNPAVTVTPESWDFKTVHASDEASKVFSVSGSNLTEGNLTLTVPEGFSVSPSSIAVNGTLNATNVTVSKNTTTEDVYEGDLSISGGGLESAKTVALTMTVDADPEPTGTFNKYSGTTLPDGYYVICSGSTTTAMKNTATAAPRIEYATVDIVSNTITDPDESVIWKLENLTGDDAGYFTLYNEDAKKYAAFTNDNGKADVITSVTDYAKFALEENSSFDFLNKGKTGKYLRLNGTYGFACYAESTGSALSLYKKQIAGQPTTPTFSVAGGNYESAQSVEIACATDGATIYYTTNGDAPTSSSTQYNGTAIAVDHTMTIKAIAIKNEISSTVASATYTIIVWQTVAEVWDDIVSGGPKNAHVYGYVSQTNVSGYVNNFYISDNGSTEGNQLYAYRMDMNSFSVAVGDKVKLAGDLTDYQGTKEFEYANQGATQGRVIALEAKGAVTSVAVSGTATKTTYSANETFETAGLVVTATYANGFSEVVTEGIEWGDDLTAHKVAATGTVHVTATVGGVISDAYGVAIEVSTKTLVSIALSADEFEVYQGMELPKPTVTATYSEGEPEDVTALAEYTGYNKNTLGKQTITVSYSFGTGDPIEESYTVTVKPIYNVELAASVARDLIINSVGSAGSGANEMIIRGIVVNPSNPSNSKQTYYISDDGSNTNTVEIFKGLYIEGANFTANNKLIAGDEVVVKGAVTYYQSSTPEFSEGSILQSLARTPNFEIEAVTGFEVGSADLAVADLTITQDGEGAVTLENSNNTDAVTIVDGNLHAVAAGTATITANLVADGIYKAATTTFSVTVIPAQVKYAITFDSNGADGGEAPEAIANKAAGAEVTLPANSYTKTGHTFDGWKVINNTTSEEVEVVAGVFEMPASAVTIQAKWAEISVWATTYTSNLADVNNGGSIVKFHGNDTEYNAIKAGTGKAAGSTTITVPAQATKLHFHAYGWNGESVTLSITAPAGVTVSPASQAISANTGISGSTSTYTLAEGSTPETDAYFAVNLSGNNDEIELTISATSGNRFVLFGVNQEGGIVPVLDHIIVTGIATALEYEVGDVFNPAGLGANAIYTLGGVEQDPVAIDAEDIEWSFEPATIAANTTAVTVTATYEGKSADKEVTDLIVSVPEPEIIVSAASLAFGNKAKGVAVDDKELTVTLKSVENATLAITGDGASAFSVTPAALTASGTVAVSASTANVGTFNATLTISDDAGAAEAKTVALSITVEASDDLSGTWNLVTDAADLMAGMQVIIANVADGEGNLYTLGGPRGNNGDNRLAVASTSTVSGTVLNPEAGTKVLTLVDAGNGLYALQLVNGNYLYAASSSSNYLKEKETLDDNGKWSISISEGKANIVSQGTNTRNTIRHNYSNNSNLFSCYASGQQDIVLYAKMKKITNNATISDAQDVAGVVIIVKNEKLTINAECAPASIIVRDHATVAINANTETNNLTVEAGGKVDVDENKTLDVDNLYIQSNQSSVSSSQIINAANLNLSGDAYFDITFDETEVSAGWYAFAVPFQVDVQNGIYNAKNGTKLANETDYAVMTYQGDVRATGEYGWIKVHKKGGKLVPGQLYIIAFGDTEYNKIRFKKDAGAALNTSNKVDINTYASEVATDAGWNGIGNSTLHYANSTLYYANASMEEIDHAQYYAQYLNHESNTFVVSADPISSEGYVVGSAFFVQASGDRKMTFGEYDYTSGTLTLHAPARNEVTDEFMLTISKEGKFHDRLFVSASETASNDYEIGHDLVKLGTISGAAKVAQIAVNGYNDINLCDAEFPLVNNQAIFPLVLTAPSTGTYTIAVERYADADLYLTYQGTVIWNLTESPYDLSLMKGRTDEYGLLLNATSRGVSTGVEQQIEKNGVEKFIMNDQLYILHNGVLYNANGQKVK